MKKNDMPVYRWKKNGQRFYTARITSDMLGWWVVTCEWGSLHSRLGNTQENAYQTRSEACVQLQEVAKRRKARGYMEVADVRGTPQ